MANSEIKDEQLLLEKMYEVQEKMLPLIDGGAQDPDYISYCNLIRRLEEHLSNNVAQTLI